MSEKTPVTYKTAERRWSPRAIESTAATFLDQTTAVTELTDNEVSRRNRNPDRHRPTSVTVTTDRKHNFIRVSGRGGQGNDDSGIEQFAHIGETDDSGISHWGAGGAFAVFHLAESLEIQAKKPGEQTIYSATIPDFGDSQHGFQGSFAIQAAEVDQDQTELGEFMVTLRKLKDPHHTPQAADLKRHFSWAYRPILSATPVSLRSIRPVEDRVAVSPEGRRMRLNDRVVMFVSDGRTTEQVMPARIPLAEGYSEEKLMIMDTENGEPIVYWIGELDLSDQDAAGIRPGFNVYYDGRRININPETFGYPLNDPRAQGIIGEIHLDHLPLKDTLGVNKSQGFNRDSDVWQRVETAMRGALDETIREIINKNTLAIPTETSHLNKPMTIAQRLIIEGLPTVLNNTLQGEFTTEEFLQLTGGVVLGQRDPSHPTDRTRSRGEPRGEGRSYREQRALTAMPEGANPRRERRRIGYCERVVPSKEPNPSRTSALVDMPNADHTGTIKTLILYENHPLVQLKLGLGELSQIMLIGEELIHQVAIRYSDQTSEADKLEQSMLQQFGHAFSSSNEIQQIINKKSK